MNCGIGVFLSVVLALCCHFNGAISVLSECEHGTLSADRKTCICEPCWTGTICSEEVKRLPYFHDGDLKVNMHDGHLKGEPLYVAKEHVEENCKTSAQNNCPCADITYSITGNNKDSIFAIDKNTGELRFNLPFKPLLTEYYVQIGASDDKGNLETMLLTIDTNEVAGPEASERAFFGEFSEDGIAAQPHHIQKRAVTLPGTVQFSLVKYGAHSSLTTMKVGTRIQFRLEITFPESHNSDMQVELFAPDSDNVIMMLCEVKVTKGKNVAVTGTLEATMESMDNSKYNDHAIIKLDTVTNTGADKSEFSHSQIIVTYEAVMIESQHSSDGAEYWVSAGAEFNSKNDVWVGQASFTADKTDDSSTFTTSPVLNLKGPSSLEIGQSALYSLDMDIIQPVVDLKIDVFASVNVSDVMSICKGKLISVSEGYSCGIGDLWSYESKLYADGNTQGHGRLHLDLGRPINKLARESSNATEQRLSLQFVVKMHDNENLIGNQYWLGSSVQIGTKKIWAGQVQVSATAKTAGSAEVTPFQTSFIGSDKVSPTDVVAVQMDIEIKPNSKADYVVEILVPVNDSQSVFQACNIAVESVGDNLGCLNTAELIHEYSKSDENSLIPDKLSVNLGTIVNFGDWGTVSPDKMASKNTLSLALSFKGMNHSLAIVGSKHDVIIGIYSSGKKLTVGRVTIEVGPATPIPEIGPGNSPDFNMYFSTGENTASFGQAVKFYLDFTTVRNITYSPLDFEFIMANESGNPMAHICKVEAEEVGKNLPCVRKDYIEAILQKISSFGDNVHDRAILNLLSICNKEISTDSKEDRLKLAVSVLLEEQPVYQSNNKTWFSSGVMYSDKTLWVGQLAMYARTTAGPPTANIPPHVTHEPFNASITHVPHGYSSKHFIHIKLAPNETTNIKLNLTAMDNAVSICALRYVRAGAGFPCAERLWKDKVGVVSGEDESLGINKEGYFDLGMTANVGIASFQTIDGYDDNTIELEFLAKMTTDTVLAPDSSTHEVQLVVTYDTTSPQTLTSTVTLTTTTDTSSIIDSLADSVNATSYIGSISGTNDSLPNELFDKIVVGESKRVMISIETELNTTSQLTVKLMTPTSVADVMNVDYLGVYEVGSNLPCAKRGQTSATYVGRASGPHKDIGTLNLGYVCNTGYEKTNSSSNMLTIEGVIRLDRDANVNINDQLTFHTSVNSNGQELHLFAHVLTVADPATFSDYFLVNETAKGLQAIVNNETAAITLAMKEEKTIPIVFTIPPYMTAKVTADIRMPVNTSAIITVNEVKLVASGKNVPDMANMAELYKFTPVRAFNTSQITRFDLDFGVISNAGMSQRTADYVKWDDTFTLEVTIQMADQELSSDTSTHKISFGLDVSQFIYILDVVVTASRTGSEELKFNITAAVDDVNSTSSRIEMDLMIAHDDASKREGLNTVLIMFLPPYVSYTDTIITSPYKTVERVEKDGNAISVHLASLFFTDAIYLTTVIEANNSYKVPPGVSGSDSVFQYQVVADTFDQYNISSDLEYVNFTTTTVTESGSSCSPAALGMQSLAIKDCQISASRDSIADPINGRHTVGSGWSPFVHTGKVKEERYYQVFFGHKTLVHSISLQQSGASKLNKVNIRHSDDGIAWVENSANEIAVDNSQASQDLTVPLPVASRYFRVMLTESNAEDLVGVYKFEFTGCATTSDGPADLCTGYKEPTKLSDFHSRSFLVVGSTLFVCDGRKKDLGIEQICYASSDDQTWKELDPRVGSMLGYDSEDNRIFGVSADGLTYMTSADGEQWSNSVPADVTTKKASLTFKPAKKVPLISDVKLNTDSPHADYVLDGYGATVHGVYKDDTAWVQKFQWGSCC